MSYMLGLYSPRDPLPSLEVLNRKIAGLGYDVELQQIGWGRNSRATLCEVCGLPARIWVLRDTDDCNDSHRAPGERANGIPRVVISYNSADLAEVASYATAHALMMLMGGRPFNDDGEEQGRSDFIRAARDAYVKLQIMKVRYDAGPEGCPDDYPPLFAPHESAADRARVLGEMKGSPGFSRKNTDLRRGTIEGNWTLKKWPRDLLRRNIEREERRRSTETPLKEA